MNTIESWVLALAILAIAAFVFQVVAIVITARSVRRVAEQVDRQSRSLQETLTALQSRLHEVADSLQPVQTVAHDLAANLEVVSEALKTRGEQADSVLRELMSVGRDQAAKIDYLVSDTVEKFEQTTETIQKDLLKPAVEISSFIRGIRSGMQVLFSGRRQNQKRSGEDGLFI